MTTLEQIKKEHPEWCFKCYYPLLSLEHQIGCNIRAYAFNLSRLKDDRDALDKERTAHFLNLCTLRAQLAELDTPCEWPMADAAGHHKLPCRENHWSHGADDFCPGCGHPVVVKEG